MSSYVFYENLPDGVHDVLLGPQNGLYLTGYDSRRRITFVLYAPPFGQRLRYISQLPYRDYGQFAPTVLGAHEESRGTLLILLYQRPISWGSESMALYRVSPEDGSQTLLSSTPSPFWPPTALLPRSDGSVLVATSGSGPLLRYDGCNATACAGPSALASAASNATGKAGLAEVRTAHGKTLCLVTGSDQLTGRGGSICCERRDGSLQTIWAPATATATAAAPASAAADSPSPAPVLPPAPPPEGAASVGGAPERDPPGGDPARRARLEAPEAWGSGNRSSSSSSSRTSASRRAAASSCPSGPSPSAAASSPPPGSPPRASAGATSLQKESNIAASSLPASSPSPSPLPGTARPPTDSAAPTAELTPAAATAAPSGAAAPSPLAAVSSAAWQSLAASTSAHIARAHGSSAGAALLSPSAAPTASSARSISSPTTSASSGSVVAPA
mmetsp:Transcript_13698/g.43065  ORF Transcript_13698/g.43065 Transcript_13698/m.43065 type:complete len:445 (-) Transcript_13698:662-1996(-)